MAQDSTRTARARVAPNTAATGGRGDIRLADIARTWLDLKLADARVRDPRNSDEARRGDLCRFGRALRGAALDVGGHDLSADLADLTVSDVQPDRFRRAKTALERRYSNSTVARTMATVRGFVTWLVDRKDVAGDERWVAALACQRPAADTLERTLTAREVAAMVAAAADPGTRDRSAWPARDQAVLAVLAGGGLRASEVCALATSDLQPTTDPQSRFAATLHVEGNGRERHVPVDADTLDALEAYLAERPPGSGTLFMRDGRAMDRSYLHRLVKRCAREAGVEMPGAAVVHALRHHLGVRLALDGEPAAVIQARLGHADGRMAALYQSVAARLASDSSGEVAALVDAATPRTSRAAPRGSAVD